MTLSDITEAEYIADILENSNDINDFWNEVKDRNNKMINLYNITRDTKVGDYFTCPTRRNKVKKKYYQQCFCPPITKGKKKTYKCKDRYHNSTNISRWRINPNF